VVEDKVEHPLAVLVSQRKDLRFRPAMPETLTEELPRQPKVFFEARKVRQDWNHFGDQHVN
jgi:hypothetical protein